MTLVAVTGLRAEARIARRAGFAVVCAGGSPDRTAAALDQAIAAGASGLISFGIAGGLAPGLAAGTLILADAVCTIEGHRFPVSAAWRRRVAPAPGVIAGDILGASRIAAMARGKAALYAATGALALDLESLVVARAAGLAGLPFLALRAIADPAERDLPPAALVPLRPDGRPDLPRIAAAVLSDPRQLPALWRLAGETRRALAALRRSATRLGAALPVPDAPTRSLPPGTPTDSAAP